jgi:hypothetical protein
MTRPLTKIKADYRIVYVGVEWLKDDTRVWHLRLTSISRDSDFRSGDLWVDGEGMPRQARIAEMNHDWTTVFLSNIRKNIAFKGERFRLKYPSNVKRLKV